MATLQFSTSVPQRNSFLVYIAGVQVPALSVSVTSGVWQIPTVNIEMAPDRELIRLGANDRVPFAIFYLDQAYTQSQGKPPDFRLLAEGELTGWQYQNTANGRSIVFSGSDYFSVFLQLYPYFMTGYNDLMTGLVQPNPGGSPVTISEFTFPAGFFFQGLDNSSGNFIKRPFDFISNMVQSICSTTSYANYKSSVTLNFFSRWMRKNNFLNRIAPSPVLEDNLAKYPGQTFPMMQTIQSTEALSMFMPALSQSGDRIANSSSMWALIQSIFSKMYYEISINPAPACVTTDLTGAVQGPPVFANGGSTAPGAAGSGSASPTMPVRLLNYVTKPALQFCVPPACNVLYPSMVKSFAYGESYIAQPTRAYFNDELVNAVISDPNASSSTFNSLIATTVASPARAQQEIAAIIGNPIRSGKNFVVWPNEYFIGPVVYRAPLPNWFTFLAKATSTANQPLNSNIIYQLYADYELQRMKCDAKSGAVVTIFDPYVVAGHPGVIFDNLEVGNHVFAYFNTVTHNLSVNEASTQIGYSFAQTFSDFFDQMANDLGNLSNFSASDSTTNLIASTQQQLTQASAKLLEDQAATPPDTEAIATDQQNIAALQTTLQILQGFQDVTLDASPASPIPVIRTQFQNISNADDYYTELFFRGKLPANQASVFNWREVIGIADPQNPSTPADIYFDVGKPLPGQTTNPISSNATSQNGEPDFQLKPLYAKIAAQSTAGLMSGSRPICTLEEYINFHGPRGQRIQPVGPADQHGLGATYYAQILNYEVAPATAPVETPPGSGNIAAPVTADIAQDWVSSLMNYRVKILGQVPLKA